eukprot:gene9179-1470_t
MAQPPQKIALSRNVVLENLASYGRANPKKKSAAKLPYPNHTSSCGNARGGDRTKSFFSSRGRGQATRSYFAKNTRHSNCNPNEVIVTISLLKSSKDLLVTNSFSAEINAILRNHSGRFDRERSNPGWVISFDMYNSVLQHLSTMKQKVQVHGLPKWVLKAMQSENWNAAAVLDAAKTVEDVYHELQERIPLEVLRKLLPYQLSGVLCAIKRGGRVLWCDEMGLGKTVQALVTCMYYKHEWPLLIVCPSSLKLTWAMELEHWLGLGDDVVQIVHNGKEKLTHAVCILSYDLARVQKEELRQRKFRIIIADEAHYMKSRQSLRSKILVPLIHKAHRALLLTGTPALSKPIELFQPLHALRRDLFTVEVAFGQRYCNSHMTAFGWCHDGSSNSEELYTLLHHTVMIRREKTDVLQSLPPKTRQKVLVDCSTSQRRDISRLMKKNNVSLQLSNDSGGSLDSDRHAVVLRLFQMTGMAKLDASTAYILDQVEKKAKLLVFAHHQDVMNGIMMALCKKGIPHIRIDGTTPSSIRQELVSRYQNDDNCRVAVLSITAAGTGLTLHAATMVVFLELYWNPGQLLQAEDRAHRVGQQCTVDVKYIICKNTLDEKIWAKVEKKMAVVGEAISGAVSTMDADQIRAFPAIPLSDSNKTSRSIQSYFSSHKALETQTHVQKVQQRIISLETAVDGGDQQQKKFKNLETLQGNTTLVNTSTQQDLNISKESILNDVCEQESDVDYDDIELLAAVERVEASL